jgi:NADPH-dependent curcumin reductase CurA
MTATAIIWKGPVEAGEVQKDNFIQQEQPIPAVTDGTALVEIQTLSVDPYMRVSGRERAEKSSRARQRLRRLALM